MSATEIMRQPDASGNRVAVVGSGISGISTAWLLHRSGFEVTVFEKDATCGGHTLTDDSSEVPVDLGFQVFNFTNYPNFVGFLDCLGIDSEPSDMSFSLSVDGGGLEWASFGLSTIFAQRKNLTSPAFWMMILDVLRFNRNAPEVLNRSDKCNKIFGSMTLGQYLKRGRYSKFFCAKYLLPMCAAIWSVSTATVLDFPVQMLVQFWVNHHLLSLIERPLWRVVKNRSRSYVLKVLEEVADVHVGAEVVELVRGEDNSISLRARLENDDMIPGQVQTFVFDQVVLACHSDQALKILGAGATAMEREVLGGIPYSLNDVYLHTDATLMPRNKNCWASWNCLEDEASGGVQGGAGGQGDAALGATRRAVCVTYWLNHLQNLPAGTPTLLCTLNPIKPPEEGSVLKHLQLAHPVFGPNATASQAKLPGIQGKAGVWFAGAWTGYGFHEDGLKAGMQVAKGLGATIPWTPRSRSPNMSLMSRMYLALFTRFAKAAILKGSLRVLLPDGSERWFGAAPSPGGAPDGKPGSFLEGVAAEMRVMDMAGLARVVKTADIGLGEAFMLREVETPDLRALMYVMCGNVQEANSSLSKMGVFNWAGMALAHVAHKLNANTVEGSRRNISAHYDAGNDMYKLFLDPTMMYSAAVHTPEEIAIARGGEAEVDLHAAQVRKLDEIVQRADIAADHHVLEIGCGWGAFAIHAAKRTGCKVTGVTISREQLTEAKARVKAEGLEHLVDLRFCDYRHLPKTPTFDRVVSIEMIEAVGHEHLQSYFDVISRVLRPGGKAVIQVITRQDEGYNEYTASSDFIRAHIFPGGHLPCMAAMVQCAQQAAAPLNVSDVKDIGLDYAVTLHEWRRRWNRQHPELLALGYNEVFIRKYDFYFAYCEAAFAAKYIHDYIITWSRAADHAAELPDVVAAATPLVQESKSDNWTQLVLLVYVFLCGVCVGRVEGLWMAPISAAFFVFAVKALPMLAPSTWPCAKAGRWASAMVDMLYATTVSAAFFIHVYHQKALPPTTDQLQHLILCGALGFYTFKLWSMITQPPSSVHSICLLVLVLVCVGAAVVKQMFMEVLVLALVCEVNSACNAAERLLKGSNTLPSLHGTMSMLSKATFLLFRVLPHLALTAYIWQMRTGFIPPYTFVMGFGGILVVNAYNMRLLLSK